MTKPIIIAVARVKEARVVQPQNGKPFLSVKLEMQPDEYNGKSYTTKIEARVRWKYDELKLRAGEWVTVQGQAKAESFEYQGKHYGSLICDMATITRIAVSNNDDAGQSPPTANREQQQELPARKKPIYEEDPTLDPPF